MAKMSALPQQYVIPTNTGDICYHLSLAWCTNHMDPIFKLDRQAWCLHSQQITRQRKYTLPSQNCSYHGRMCLRHGWTIAIAAADAEHRWWWSLIIAVAMMVTRFEPSYVICDLRLGFLSNLKLIDKAQSTSVHGTRWKTGYSVGDN